MAWRYLQRLGWLFEPGGHLLAQGYSGKGEGKNNPALVTVENVGPIPAGEYAIGEPEDLKGGKHGPYVLPLTPAAGNAMHGRSGFLVHGDSIEQPGTASEGCIVLPLAVRQAMGASEDRVLVVEGPAEGVRA